MKNETPLKLVTSYLQEQKKCYDMLLIKLEDQKKAIMRTDEARLMAVIEEKDVLINDTQRLEEKIGAVFKGVSENEREQLIEKTGVLRRQIENSLKELIALEAACQDVLNIEKIYTRNQIKELQQKKNVFKGYEKPGEDTTRFSEKT